MNEYDVQANEFLKKNNIRFSVLETYTDICNWDNQYHFMHKVRFYNRSTKKSMTLTFTTSLNDYQNGDDSCRAYDVLACIQKYDVGSIEDFVSEFGYTFDTWEEVKKTEKTYKAVVHEYKGVQRVFADCLDELRDIA